MLKVQASSVMVPQHLCQTVCWRPVHGNIIGTVPVDVASKPGQLEPFQIMLAGMSKLENLDEVKYASFIVLNFQVVDAQPVYTILRGLFNTLEFLQCDIVGVAHHGHAECSAVCRRTRPKVKLTLPVALAIKIAGVYVFKLHGKSSAQVADLTFQFLQAWGEAAT